MHRPYFFPLMLAFSLLIGCNLKDTSDDSTRYNPYVKSFTTGTVSRFSPVYLIFSEDIPADKLQSVDLAKQVRIKPEVKGEFFFEDAHTVGFKPAEALERGREYRITADLSRWFDTSEEDARFLFKFSTYPLTLRVEQQPINVNEEEGFDFVYTIFTPDRESPETVEALVRASEKAEMSWQHHTGERSHILTLSRVPAREKAYELSLSVAPNAWGLREETLATSHVPSANEFLVNEVRFLSEPERYVEVVFSEKLEPSQPLQGLAYIGDSKNETVTLDGNKLRLYPDRGQSGLCQVFLSGGLRSTKGKTLGEDTRKEVEVIDALPAVRFTGEGTIIPQSGELNLPFQAIYLRGVVVRITKILENNIGQFMQMNRPEGDNGLAYIGRPVARKTIFFDGEGFQNWKTYAIRLNDLIEPEPGAIYRVELSISRDLSAYPCEDDAPRRSREELEADDERKFKDEVAQYDSGNYYYYGESAYDYYEDYDSRKDPCSSNYYYHNIKAKNILATNLGVMAFGGEGDEFTVLVHNLLSTTPERGVSVELYNYQHQLVGTGLTDEKGQAHIPAKGKPYYLIASQGRQRAYLHIDAGTALSLSSFDVAGEVVQKGVKGFIYGERGVWRPGDTLHLGFLLNDRLKNLPATHPVSMELFNPLGQSYIRKTQTHGEMGLYAFDLPTDSDAPTGAWQVKVEVGGASFTQRLRIEAIKPNRLKIALSLPEQPLLKGVTNSLPLHTEWLQGSVARKLRYQIEGVFSATPTEFTAFKGYVFDDPSKTFQTEKSELITGTTDEMGDAEVEARFETGIAAPGMLKADLVTRVFEPSGDFSIDGSSLRYSPYTHYVGIRSPQKERVQLDTDKSHTFEVANVDHLGNPTAAQLQVDVYAINRYWWWESSYDYLGYYISNSYLKIKEQKELTTDANGRGSFNLKMGRDDWGSYFIRIKNKTSGHTSGLVCYFDWPGYARDFKEENALTRLNIRTDKPEYSPGEYLTLTFPSTEGSRAIICVANGTKKLALSEHLCQAGETSIRLSVTPDMQPNAYLYVSLIQPHGKTDNDLPIRLYGVAPVTVTSPESQLNPEVAMPTEIKPESAYKITVSEKDGRPMAYTLAVVDEGLLDLTHFNTPDPWKAFNAREALGVSLWDMYNQVLGAYGGRIEQLFSIGGDDALNRAPKAIVNRFKPVVHFEGPFLLKKGEKKAHSLRMPNYNGRVRVMVVAGDGEAYGHTEKSAFVRKPVMLLGTLPRLIGIGEEMVVPATVFATEEGVGKVNVSIACSDNMEIMGSHTQELNFSKKEDQQALFRIRVKDTPGAGKVSLTATGKGEPASYETDIEIRSVSRPVSEVSFTTIAGGKSWKNKLQLPGIDGTNSLALEVSTMPPIDLHWRLDYLLGYPHGCIEQITSKGFPQLYLKEIAALSTKEAAEAEAAIKEVLRRYRSYQVSGGGFSYWPGGSASADDWGSVYATHFMLEAEGKGFLVAASMKRNALNSLRKAAREWKSRRADDRWDMRTQAYRLYVLALGQTPEMGAMNRLKEDQHFKGTGVWLLAAAYAKAGREDVANDMISAATTFFDDYTYDYYTYGSNFRDLGICLQTLCLLKREEDANKVARQIADALSSKKWLSTQETAYALIGITNYMNRFKTGNGLDFSYTAAGKSQAVKSDKALWIASLFEEAPATAEVELKNASAHTLFVRLVAKGTPLQDEVSPHAHNVSLNVRYLGADGQTMDVNQLEQGTNFTAVVRVKNTSFSQLQNLALMQVFPSGWEILNTRYLNEEGASASSNPAGISYQDIRDDRVYTYIDQLYIGAEVSFRINLSAVYAGRFYLPPVYCESMYDNETQANTEARHVKVE